MDKYEVTIRDTTLENKWTMIWWADGFAHAEEQTIDMLKSTKVDHYSTIVNISKDYE